MDFVGESLTMKYLVMSDLMFQSWWPRRDPFCKARAKQLGSQKKQTVFWKIELKAVESMISENRLILVISAAKSVNSYVGKY